MTRRYNDPTAGSAITQASSYLRDEIDRMYPPFDCRPTNRWEAGEREGYGRRWWQIGPFGFEGKRRPRGTMSFGKSRGPRLKGQRK